MTSFGELTKQVHLINDIILTDMVCEEAGNSDRVVSFSHHLLATKYWFSRICWSNKKRYVLALLEDVRNAWTLSLLLKSMWNCRPKDAVLSSNESPVWSSYDQVPMDHNRTALPITTLAQVMKNDRMWFLNLDSEAQAMVLSELLTIAGGPVMWVVLRRAQVLYERYRNMQLQNIQECIVVMDTQPVASRRESAAPHRRESAAPPPPPPPPEPKVKKVQPQAGDTADPSKLAAGPGKAQRELEINLAEWNATIKSIRERQKLEELEMALNDGTHKKIWMVNRPKPEAIETVDLIQLLPASVGMRVLWFLPSASWGDCAKVNRYWAYLVDELKAEITARVKINTDLEKLTEVMLRHDQSLELVEQLDYTPGPASSLGQTSVVVGGPRRPAAQSVRASEKSAGVYSMRHFLLDKPNKVIQKPVRNMADFYERLETRGAADENLWRWCELILRNTRHIQVKLPKTNENDHTYSEKEGVLPLVNAHFPCPMMKHGLKVPLKTPLYKDPARIPPAKPHKNVSDSTVLYVPQDQGIKRFSLWSRDFSPLYPVYKIPSYQSPI